MGTVDDGETMSRDEQTHALELAGELLADIELDRSPLDKQVLKASRLARLVKNEEASAWLGRERGGFYQSDIDKNYFLETGRGGEEPTFGGVVSLIPLMQTYQEELAALRVPDVSGDWAYKVASDARRAIAVIRNEILQYQLITSKVSARLHTFVSTTYYQLHFSTQQDSMFERAKTDIDALLAGLGLDSLRRIDSAYAGLQAGDPESISAAMNSVRRLIDGFADQVFPASADTRVDGQGNTIKLGAQQRLNRIRAYIDDNAQSESRAKRLKHSVADIYARVSTGVHNDVSISEAKYLFLSTYVLLGEVLSLPGRTAESTEQVAVD